MCIDTNAEDDEKVEKLWVGECTNRAKCRQNVTRENCIPGKGQIYLLQGTYTGFDEGKSPEEQVHDHSDTWQQAWGMYECIMDYYKKYPSLII